MWSDVFAPIIWETVDDSIEPWASIAQSFWQPNLTEIDGLSTSKDTRKVHLDRFVRSCRYIKHLTIHHAWTLELCLAAQLTGLASLQVVLGTGVSQCMRRNHLLMEKRSLLLSPPSITVGPSPPAVAAKPGIFFRILGASASSNPSPTPHSPLSITSARQLEPQHDEYTDEHDLEWEDSLARQVFQPWVELNDGPTSFELLPNALFSVPRNEQHLMSSQSAASVEITQKCWQFIYNNRTTLKRLDFSQGAKRQLHLQIRPRIFGTVCCPD